MDVRNFHINRKEKQNILIAKFNLIKSDKNKKREKNISKKNKMNVIATYNKNEEKFKYKKYYNINKNIHPRNIRLLINHIIINLFYLFQFSLLNWTI